MLEVLCQYEDHLGCEKAILCDKKNEDDVYCLNLSDMDSSKLQCYEIVESIYEDIDFEKPYEMQELFKKNLIEYIKKNIKDYESGWDEEDVMERQLLEWLDDDPFFDGGYDKDKFFKWVKHELNEWSKEEYGSDLDLSDLKKIGIAYTNAGENDEFEIQVYIDLIDFKMWTEINGNEIVKEKFNSLNEFWDKELSWMNFDSLVCDAINYCESEK